MTPNQENAVEKPVELSYYCSSFTNTFKVTLLFSIRKRKFVKPVLMKHLKVFYKILPGTYVMFSSSGRLYVNEHAVYLELVRITNESYDVVKRTKIFASMFRDKNDFSAVNENNIVKDFVNAVPPRYHSYPSINFDKTYSEQDVNELLKLFERDEIYLYQVEE